MSSVKYNKADNVHINVNIEGRMRNHRCHEKAVRIQSKCLSVPLVIQQVKRTRRIM